VNAEEGKAKSASFENALLNAGFYSGQGYDSGPSAAHSFLTSISTFGGSGRTIAAPTKQRSLWFL